MSEPVAAYVGLGGNLGGARAVRARIDAALAAIGGWPWVVGLRASVLYVSAPLGPVAAQPPFLNAVAELVVEAPPAPTAVLAALLALEATLGRRRSGEVAQGPRAIDLDLLLFGEVVLRDPGPPPLILPHPRLVVRKFALRPLAELTGPMFRIPGVARSLGDLLATPAVADQRVEPLRLRL
jgi:2-amino-4-hydroxy-6-hydroxymethyldihydropteridine diphosphokinase